MSAGREAALFAVRMAVGVVVVTVGPDRERDSFCAQGARRDGRARDGPPQGARSRYSSQPHWIHRNGVSESKGSNERRRPSTPPE